MNILARGVRKATNLIRRTIGPLIDDHTIMRSLRTTGLLSPYDMDMLSAYKDSVWVYASIKLIGKQLAKIPANIVDAKTGKEIITSGDVYDLWSTPNMFMDSSQFLEAVSILCNIYGEAIVAMGRESVSDVPIDMWPLNPSSFSEMLRKIGDKSVLTGWEYTGTSPSITFSLPQILFPRYFNPYHPIRGLSPLTPAKLSIEQHYFSSVYNKRFFQQGVRVEGFVEVEDSGMDDDTFNRLASQFDAHEGMYNAHKVAIIEGGKFHETRITQKDMEFISLNKLSREEAFAALGTNEVVLGLYEQVQSYEGMRQAYKQFWEDCMVPHVFFLEKFFNNNFFKYVSKGQQKLKFDLAAVGALHDDYKVRVDTAKIMTNMGFPLNDVNDRLELGMPHYAWGNTWYVPWGAIPVEQVLNNTGNNNNQQQTQPNVKPSEEASKPKPAKEVDDELSKHLWNRYLSSQTVLEEMLRNKVKGYLFEQRKSVIDALSKDKVKLLDFEKERVKLQRMLGSLYIEVMKVGAQMVTAEVGMEDSEKTLFSAEFPEVVKYVQIRLSLIPTKLMQRIEAQLQEIFSNSTSKTVKQEEVRSIYNKLARIAKIIARNESSQVLVVGRVIQMQRLGVRYHKWISSRRVTSRSSHLSLNNKVAQIGESFVDTITLRYPGDLMASIDETNGCTCFTVPVTNLIEGNA